MTLLTAMAFEAQSIPCSCYHFILSLVFYMYFYLFVGPVAQS